MKHRVRISLGLFLLATACAGRYPDARQLAEALPASAGQPTLPARCLVANHVHTLVSDRYSHDPRPDNAAHAYSPRGLAAALAAFTADGVDAIVVTDHNAIDAAFDPQLARPPIAGRIARVVAAKAQPRQELVVVAPREPLRITGGSDALERTGGG